LIDGRRSQEGRVKVGNRASVWIVRYLPPPERMGELKEVVGDAALRLGKELGSEWKEGT
jgi:hypothetical protein